MDTEQARQRYDRTARAYSVALAEAAGGHIEDLGDALLVAMPFDHPLNGVFDVRFSAKVATLRIKEILGRFRQWRSGVRIRLGPPGSSGLEAACARPVFSQSKPLIMAGSLCHLPSPRNASAGVTFFAVSDYRLFERRPHPLYGLTKTHERRRLMAAYQTLAEDYPRRHWTFVAEERGELVASVTLFQHDSTVGGQGMVVRKDRRRLGLGTDLLLHAASILRDQGAVHAAFATSIMGGRFYPYLGLGPVGKCVICYCSWERLRSAL